MAFADHVEPIRALAVMAREIRKIPVNAVAVGEDGSLELRNPPPPSQFQFLFDGVRFTMNVTPEGQGYRYRLTALVGILPFTVQNRLSRLALLTIVSGCRDLGGLHFVIAKQQRIWLIAEGEVAEIPTPEAVLHQMTSLLHRARPCLRLILAHL